MSVLTTVIYKHTPFHSFNLRFSCFPKASKKDIRKKLNWFSPNFWSTVFQFHGDSLHKAEWLNRNQKIENKQTNQKNLNSILHIFDSTKT